MRRSRHSTISPDSLLDGFADIFDAQARKASMLRSEDSALEDLPLMQWVQKYRCLYKEPYPIYPLFEEIYNSTHPRIFVRKAAQVFVSEYLINVALWISATAQGKRGVSLYVFPKEKQLGDFCRGRIDTAINGSPAIKSILGKTDNVQQKAIGSGFIYLRGAQTQESLISVDADCVLGDEVARYPSNTIDLIEKRLGSSYLGWIRAGSTPVYPSDVAGTLWNNSSQKHYEIRCSHCGTWQPLTIESNFNPETITVFCTHCKGDLAEDRITQGVWTSNIENAEWEGYQLNKLYSPRANLKNLALTYLQILQGNASQSRLQEFFNQDAGIPYLPKGGHLDTDIIDRCIDENYDSLPSIVNDQCIMGIDVGSFLHVVILQKQHDYVKLVFADTFKEFEDINILFQRYNIRFCVVDSLPETRAAREFAKEHRGKVWLATYAENQESNKSDLCAWNDDAHTVRINRTMALDTLMHTVAQRNLILPRMAHQIGDFIDVTGVGAFYRQLCSPIRILVTDAKTGETTARYDQNGPDHYAHAMLYSLIAANRPSDVVNLGIYPSQQNQEDIEEEEEKLYLSMLTAQVEIQNSNPRKSIPKVSQETLKANDLSTYFAPQPKTKDDIETEIEQLDFSNALA